MMIDQLINATRKAITGWRASRLGPGTTLLVLMMACISHLPAQTQPIWGEGLDGTKVTELAPSGTHVLVLFFVASDCPISNRTFPEMQRLREKYELKGVTFWYVYPNDGETMTTIAEHQASYDRNGHALLTHSPEIVRLGHALATPEVAVLHRSGSSPWLNDYAGRIDNRYVKFGLERPKATEHFADDAITAVLAGRKPAPATGNIVGCSIMSPGARR
ncbi:AhpC/TSA family protein [Bryocella elongata]|uniref:AhpC/TSA family protein n=1 Tax=Bryocella elongata TaxID=863522 RepID=A0A1H5U981_9BACT|nr:redoxin domain-containing protein [Bryocella elongata]SEF70901.1 AhpC/TSA family protein [Bryocella elongata]